MVKRSSDVLGGVRRIRVAGILLPVMAFVANTASVYAEQEPAGESRYHEVGNSVWLSVSSNTAFAAHTSRQVEFPDDVGTPIFWIDCSDTNGWTFTAEGGVLRLPSKVPGSTRYLTSDKNDPDYGNFTWKFFGYPNEYAAREPV